MSPFDQTRARRYLLGQLSEDETSALETEYFASGETLERVADVETDLVDDFVRGGLAAEERSAFESHYLASAVHRERVATARLLRAATQGAARPAPRHRVPAWGIGLTLAAGLVLMLASLWLRERPQPTDPVARAEATPTVVATTGSPAGPLVPTPAATLPSRQVVAAFALSPMLLRGAQGTPTLRVPPGTEVVALTLQGEVPQGVAAGTRLPFAVGTVEGAGITRGQVQVTAEGLGVARIDAARLPAGDYILSVGAEPPLRQYFFRVAR